MERLSASVPSRPSLRRGRLIPDSPLDTDEGPCRSGSFQTRFQDLTMSWKRSAGSRVLVKPHNELLCESAGSSELLGVGASLCLAQEARSLPPPPLGLFISPLLDGAGESASAIAPSVAATSTPPISFPGVLSVFQTFPACLPPRPPSAVFVTYSSETNALFIPPLRNTSFPVVPVGGVGGGG